MENGSEKKTFESFWQCKTCKKFYDGLSQCCGEIQRIEHRFYHRQNKKIKLPDCLPRKKTLLESEVVPYSEGAKGKRCRDDSLTNSSYFESKLLLSSLSLLKRQIKTQDLDGEHRTRKIIDILLEDEVKVKDQLAAFDDEGRTPLHLAVQTGDAKLVRRLLGLGSLRNAYDTYKKSPLHLAIENFECNWNKEIERPFDKEKFKDHFNLVVELINNDMDLGEHSALGSFQNFSSFLNAQDYQGSTAFHYVATFRIPPLIWLLQMAHADMTIKNNNSETPLSIYARCFLFFEDD